MTDLPETLGPEQQLSLAELVNRVLDRGAIVTGEVVISVAGIDLLYVGLQLVLSSTETARKHGVIR
ncbi:MAG: gas vesicle protein [Gemmatimonadota bacterium]